MAALRASDIDYRAPAANLPALLDQLLSAAPGPAIAAPEDVWIEVEIALGRKVDSRVIANIADPAPLSCPSCGGVLSQMRQSPPVRYRCQVGHAFTGEILAKEQETATDEAVRVALRIIEERATLMDKLANDAHRNERPKIAAGYEAKLHECRAYADTLRRAITGR